MEYTWEDLKKGTRQLYFFFLEHIDGLVQDCSNSSVLAMDFCSLALSLQYSMPR